MSIESWETDLVQLIKANNQDAVVIAGPAKMGKTQQAMLRKQLVGVLVKTAEKWRTDNKEYVGGVVLIWQGAVYGWKDCLRDAAHEQPGAFAVDQVGHVFIAAGGNEYDGAKGWVAVSDEPTDDHS